jgi:succinoglycan biosynthesis protein ExoO
MTRPRVSVITPAYNVAPYIGRCIESVQAQTLTDWEMVIVDDASTDDTVAVVERYLTDSRIKLLRNEQNMGAGYTRNRALEQAQGEWIAVLDSDDWYAPQRLERLVAFAQEMQADMVADLQTYVTPAGKVFMVGWCVHGKTPRRPRYYTPEQVIRYHPSMKPLIRGDFIRQKGIRYASHIRQSQDYAFYVEILIKGARFALLPEAMYFYQIRPQSITTDYGRNVAQFWLSCEYLCALPETTPAIRKTLLKSFRYRKSWMLYPAFANALKRRQWRRAFSLWRESPLIFWHWLRQLPAALHRRLFAMEQMYDPWREASQPSPDASPTSKC